MALSSGVPLRKLSDGIVQADFGDAYRPGEAAPAADSRV
jgi:hypothetical protein